MEIKCRGGRRRAPAPFPPAMVYFVLYAIAEIIDRLLETTPADKPVIPGGVAGSVE